MERAESYVGFQAYPLGGALPIVTVGTPIGVFGAHSVPAGDRKPIYTQALGRCAASSSEDAKNDRL